MDNLIDVVVGKALASWMNHSFASTQNFDFDYFSNLENNCLKSHLALGELC